MKTEWLFSTNKAKKQEEKHYWTKQYAIELKLHKNYKIKLLTGWQNH